MTTQYKRLQIRIDRALPPPFDIGDEGQPLALKQNGLLKQYSHEKAIEGAHVQRFERRRYCIEQTLQFIDLVV